MERIRVEQLTDAQKKERDIPDALQEHGPWSVWECAPSTFDWQYDRTEQAYVFEGRVTVKTADEEVEIKAGDFVTFPEGMVCTWTISDKIRKVYNFV